MRGHSGIRKSRPALAGLIVLATTSLVSGACTGQMPAGPPAPGPERSAWMAGDSNGGAIASTMVPGPFHISVGASGFTTRTRTRILDNTQAQIDKHGPPETMLVTGGVLDLMVGASAQEVIDEMTTFENAMVAQGMTVVFVVEPTFTLEAVYEPVADWINAHHYHVDCSYHDGYTQDGIHPVYFKPIAACVNAQLDALGIELYDRPVEETPSE
jgi:hypothetical protein